MAEQVPGSLHDEANNPESATPEERFGRIRQNADSFSRDGLDLAWELGTQGFPELPDNLADYYQDFTNEMNTVFALGREAGATTEQKSDQERQLLILQAMHPAMLYPLKSVFFHGRMDRPTDLEQTLQEKDPFDETRPHFSPERKKILIETYNLGADMAGHPHYEEPPDTTTPDTAGEAPTAESRPLRLDLELSDDLSGRSSATAPEPAAEEELRQHAGERRRKEGFEMKLNGLKIRTTQEVGVAANDVATRSAIDSARDYGRAKNIAGLTELIQQPGQKVPGGNLEEAYDIGADEREGAEPFVAAPGGGLVRTRWSEIDRSSATPETMLPQPHEPGERRDQNPITPEDARERFQRMVDAESDPEKLLVLQYAFDNGASPTENLARRDELIDRHPDMENAIIAAHIYGILAAGFQINQRARLGLEIWEERAEAERMKRTGEALSRDLDAARTEYARLLVVKEKQGKNRPRERQEADEAQVGMRTDLAPIGDIAEAEHAYRAALAATRTHRGQILRENAAGLSPRKLQKEIKNLFRSSTLREANRLHDAKTDLQIGERPLLRRTSGRFVQEYHTKPTSLQTAMSGLIFTYAAYFDLSMLMHNNPLLVTDAGEPTVLQNSIVAALAAKAGQSAVRRYQKSKARQETRRAMTRERKVHDGDLLAALLDANNERLNDLALRQADRKSDEKRRRRIAAAVGGVVGYITGRYLLS